MLNLIQVDREITINGVTYPNSDAAYRALKETGETVTVTILPPGYVEPEKTPETPSENKKKKGSILDAYEKMTGESLKPVDHVEVQEPEKDPTVYEIQVKKWMTEKSTPGFDFMKKWNNDVPMPMVVMQGRILDETKGMYMMELSVTPKPSAICFKCGRELKHPVSVLYGIGPECGGHFHISPMKSQEELDAAMEDIKEKMSQVKWTGWVIKSAIKSKEIVQE